jgi:hypothetical protein
VTLRFDIRASDGSPAWTDDDIARREKRHASWRRGCTQTIAPGNRLFEEVLASNVRDFASFPLFEGAQDEWLTLQAGVPLYPAFFGRDAVTAGWQTGYVDCGESLDAALTRRGRLQSREEAPVLEPPVAIESLRPAELSPRIGVAGRAGDDPLPSSA